MAARQRSTKPGARTDLHIARDSFPGCMTADSPRILIFRLEGRNCREKSEDCLFGTQELDKIGRNARSDPVS